MYRKRKLIEALLNEYKKYFSTFLCIFLMQKKRSIVKSHLKVTYSPYIDE